MNLRRRLTFVVAGAVAVAVAMAAVVAYVGTRSELRGQIDDRLQGQVDLIDKGPPPGSPGDTDPPPGSPGDIDPPPGKSEAPSGSGDPSEFAFPPTPGADSGPAVGGQVIGSDGDVLFTQGDIPVPSPTADVPSGFSDQDVSGQHIRVFATDLPDGRSLRVVSSLEGIDSALSELRTVLFLLVVAGAGAAAVGARAFATRLLRPVEDLTQAADHVSDTEDLSRRIEVSGEDELGRLADRFNAMLARLEVSRHELDEAHEDQRRLIADASHELRTPVTALRTNIEVIATGGLAPEEERKALADASEQAAELGVLIGDLMDLARGEPPRIEFEEVDLAAITSEAVERARRHSPDVRFELDAEPSVVHGSADRLSRAINNLLDNAAEHGRGEPVEVAVADGQVTVRDHGPGLEAAEAGRLFDRFYRGREARGRPGSGLGLAIVRQIAEAHGGSVGAGAAPGGGPGAEFVIRLG